MRPDSVWLDENTAKYLQLRVKTFYNVDYFDRIVLPLLDLPSHGRVVDVGCGYGGLSLLLAERRSDLRITAVDRELAALEKASQTATQLGYSNVVFAEADARQLPFDDNRVDAVVCQTLLTHVANAEAVIAEMARVLKPGALFMAAEYSTPGAWSGYDNVGDSKRDEAWHQEYSRIFQLFARGKRRLGRGDERAGLRVPLLASAAGLDAFDVRLNDRALCVIPPYRHAKQQDYLDVLKLFHFRDAADDKGVSKTIETVEAGGGTAEDAAWFHNAADSVAICQAIDDRSLQMVSSYALYLTFARKG